MLRSALGTAMWVGRTTAAIIGLAVALAVVFGVATMALAAVPGDPLKLGKLNTINAMTRLVGTNSNTLLKVTNNGTGSALGLEVKQGVPPMRVNSSKKVPNLNADKLDGLDAIELQGPRAYAHVNADGTIDTANSKNVPAGDVSILGGFYCFSGLGFTPKNVVVTLDPGSSLGNSEIATAWAKVGPFGCAQGTQVSVVITQSGQGFKARDFYVVFN